MIFVGDDWAEAHHDVHVMDETGRLLVRRRLREGLEGVRSFHDLIGCHVDDASEVVIGIETDRGLWVQDTHSGGLSDLCDQPASRVAVSGSSHRFGC